MIFLCAYLPSAYPFAICISFAHFKNCVVCLKLESSLYILDVSALSDNLIYKYFLQVC